MNLVSRLDRLEAHIRAQHREDEPPFYRKLIYEPKEWDIREEEAIARMEANELDRLVTAGRIKETERRSVGFIINTIVYPPKYPDGPPRRQTEAA